VQAVASTQAGSGTYSQAYGSNVGSGHLLIALIALNSATITMSNPRDTLSNTWSNCAISQGSGIGVQFFYTVTSSGGADTFSVDLSAGTPGRSMVIEYSGNAASSVGESCQAGTTGSGSSCSTTSSVVTSQANDLLFAGAYFNSSYSSPGSGYALRYGWSTNDFPAEDQIAATANSYAASINATSGGCNIVAVGFKVASGSTPATRSRGSIL